MNEIEYTGCGSNKTSGCGSRKECCSPFSEFDQDRIDCDGCGYSEYDIVHVKEPDNGGTACITYIALKDNKSHPTQNHTGESPDWMKFSLSEIVKTVLFPQ